jgi:hypothetical protein
MRRGRVTSSDVGYPDPVASLADNPFATLTIVVAPAILTNASSVLSLGTGNRIARVVDRTRALRAELQRIDPSSPARGSYLQQLERLRIRAAMLLRALRFFYMSIGAFAAAALVSIVGSLLVTIGNPTAYDVMAGIALISGTIGVAGLVIGCTAMVRETRLAMRFLDEESELASAHTESTI